MDTQQARQIAGSLAHGAGVDATASQVADATALTWQAIDLALTPIVGHRGVAALYRRSLHLNREAHPFLARIAEEVKSSLNLEALKSVLAQQGSDDAAAAGGAVLQTFYELLTSLVGPSLTERLLRSVWANFLSGSAAQDTSK
jgi:hypothetical protein